jgi:hypothetical protein
MSQKSSAMFLVLMVVGIVVSLSLSGTVFGATLYVGPGETYTEIQPAINAASSGDTIIVRDGTYTGTDNKNVDFGGKAITVKSENGAQYCIIDCQGSGRGFYFHSGEGSGSVVDGFTIKNGYVILAPPSEPYDHGGGILCWGASPTIKNCTIINNRSARGGGIACYYGSPLITHCTISGNRSDVHGGAVYVYQGSPPNHQLYDHRKLSWCISTWRRDVFTVQPLAHC